MRNKSSAVEINIPTLIAISAIAISLTVGLHEGMHALTCVIVGGNLQEFSALHVLCDCSDVWQNKLVAGSASVTNLLLGFLFLNFLRHSNQKSGELRYFLWLSMLLNWVYGAGYWVFSGIGNAGDWAEVIVGWSPHWLWRIVMTIIGFTLYMGLIKLALREFGKFIGGSPPEQFQRATKLSVISYITGVIVIFAASWFHPYGLLSTPVIAGLMAVVGATSPLLWMMAWYRSSGFEKISQPALSITLHWQWIGAAIIIAGFYIFGLGPTIFF